ncbi:MAG: hypothetical protein JWO36_7128 [Myxococcales bacterium]|nr:hypothetical protein [Myxococcales bacterium]
MKATRVSAWLFAAAVAGGCTGTGDVEYGGEVSVASPDLVYVEPGVQVVADADQPLFYSDNSYWLYRDNNWYRSDSYRGGFEPVHAVPQRIREIREPRAYVHYARHHGGDRAWAREGANRQRESQPPRPTNYYDQAQPQQQQQQDWQRTDRPEWQREQDNQSRGQPQRPLQPQQPARPPQANPMPQPNAAPPPQPNAPQVPPDQRVPQPVPQRQGDNARYDQDRHDLGNRPVQDDHLNRDDRTDRNERTDRGARKTDEPTPKETDRERRDRDKADRHRDE